ncbi:MAG: sulfotransferase family protein [Bradymonadia bacterium]
MTQPVYIVSGLPRSGTSMMMSMLDAGGVPLITDGERVADEDNPKGYFEAERVKKLASGDVEWLDAAQGQAVKIISDLLQFLPAETPCRVIFMRRRISEILASQQRMLTRRGEASGPESEEMASIYRAHLDDVFADLDGRAGCEVLYINYNRMLADPGPQLEKVVAFVEAGGAGPLDREAMAGVIDQALYRNRG